MTDDSYRSIANPRRTTLVSASAAEAAAPRRDEKRLQLLADDGATCVDGACSLPD
jgi:hypothetical protein